MLTSLITILLNWLASLGTSYALRVQAIKALIAKNNAQASADSKSLQDAKTGDEIEKATDDALDNL